MSSEIFLPEFIVRSKYLSLLDFLRFYKEKVFVRFKLASKKMNLFRNEFITFFSIRSITRIRKYTLDTVFFHEFWYDFFWFSFQNDHFFSSDFFEILRNIIKCFSDKSKLDVRESSKFLKQMLIKDKYRENFFRVFYSFKESGVIIETQVLPEPEYRFFIHNFA